MENENKERITDPQRKKFFVEMHRLHLTLEDVEKVIGPVSELSKEAASEIISTLVSSNQASVIGNLAPYAPKGAPEAKGQEQLLAPVSPRQTAIAPQQKLRPEPMMSMSIEEALRLYQQFEEVKKRVLQPQDYQEWTSKRTGTRARFVKKSGWSKIQTFFGVSTEIVKVDKDYDKNGELIVTVYSRATWRGRSVVETGIYTYDEAVAHKLLPTPANIISTAATRANNRAISRLVGGGEVSAEEMSE